jgi:hypothetical protein
MLGPAAGAEIGRQAIAGSGRDDTDGRFAESEAGGHLVDRPVAAPCHDEAGALPARRVGELTRVPLSFGDEDVGVLAGGRDQPGRLLGAPTREIEGAAPGDRVQDDRNQRLPT